MIQWKITSIVTDAADSGATPCLELYMIVHSFMCVYTYVHVYIYIYMYIYIYIYVYIYIYPHMSESVDTMLTPSFLPGSRGRAS